MSDQLNLFVILQEQLGGERGSALHNLHCVASPGCHQLGVGQEAKGAAAPAASCSLPTLSAAALAWLLLWPHSQQRQQACWLAGWHPSLSQRGAPAQQQRAALWAARLTAASSFCALPPCESHTASRAPTATAPAPLVLWLPALAREHARWRGAAAGGPLSTRDCLWCLPVHAP